MGANEATKKGVALVSSDVIICSGINQSRRLIESSWAKAKLKCGVGRFSEPIVTLVVLFPYLTSAVRDARKMP